MKYLALFCAALLSLIAQPSFAEDAAAPAYVELKAPQAIELVKKQAATGTKSPALTVLDVRTPKECADGHIAGCVNIDFKDASFKAALNKLDKSQPYLVHCAAGGRSAKTRELMKELGFKKVYHLEGGYTAWKKAGGPVTAPGTAPAPAKP
jgi:phage shock protein E